MVEDNMKEGIKPVTALTSDELVGHFATSRRASLNTGLKSRIALYDYEENKKLTDEQRAGKKNDAVKLAGDAELHQTHADVVDISHREKFGISAKDALKAKLIHQQRTLVSTMAELKGSVSLGSDAEKRAWFNAYCGLSRNDVDMELVK